MVSSVPSILLVSLGFAGIGLAQYDANLVGTWSSKSKSVLTGPGFYNPVTDRLIEPALTGISYSFTSDGFYEEAYYRAIPNPTQPQCPQAIMQWQHGTYSLPGNGSIVLEPFAVDGRQLVSNPCSYGESVYTRYDQAELLKSYEVLTDPYHNIKRVNLFQFDGSPQIPLYLVYNPPQMLPTQTLNPTSSAAPAATAKSRVKRDMPDLTGERIEPMNKNANIILTPKDPYNADTWWWVGVGMTALGTIMYMMPTST